MQSGVDVAGKSLVHGLRGFIRREFVEAVAGAFAEAAIIQSKNVNSRCGELLGQIVPDFALAIALVEQQDARAGLGGKITGFQFGAVGGGEVDDSLGE